MLGEWIRGGLAGIITGAILGTLVWWFLGNTFFNADAIVIGIGAGAFLGAFLGDDFVDGMRGLITRSRLWW